MLTIAVTLLAVNNLVLYKKFLLSSSFLYNRSLTLTHGKHEPIVSLRSPLFYTLVYNCTTCNILFLFCRQVAMILFIFKRCFNESLYCEKDWVFCIVCLQSCRWIYVRTDYIVYIVLKFYPVTCLNFIL